MFKKTKKPKFQGQINDLMIFVPHDKINLSTLQFWFYQPNKQKTLIHSDFIGKYTVFYVTCGRNKEKNVQVKFVKLKSV